jgi:hypothetical protein
VREVTPAIDRANAAPKIVAPLPNGEAVYQVRLSAVPSPPWRAAFYRAPLRLSHPPYTPDQVELHVTAVIFRTHPCGLDKWLGWIDRWVAYANSVVKE